MVCLSVQSPQVYSSIKMEGRSALALRPLQLEPSIRVALSLSTRYDRAVPIVAETDAAVIARGIPSAPRPLAEEPEGAASLCAPPSQREFEVGTRSGSQCSPPPGPAGPPRRRRRWTSRCSGTTTSSRATAGWPRRQRVQNERQAHLPAARREQATEEPVFFHLRLSHRHQKQARKALRRARGEGDGAQQGAEGGREEETEGHLRGHARRGPVRGVARGRAT